MAREKKREAWYVSSMRAAVDMLTVVVEMPKPRVIDEGDVVIKVTGSTICGSDIHLYHGTYNQIYSARSVN